MLPILSSFLDRYAQFLQPLFFLLAWLFVALFILGIINFITEVSNRSRQMHKIPCHSCRYFTGSYYLKCTIHPSIAFSESAINCFDFDQDSEYGS